EPRHSHTCEHPARGTAIDADVLRSMRPEQLSIGGSDIFACGRKAMLGGLAVVQTDHSDLSDCSHGNRFEFGAGGPTADEAAAVQVDQHTFAIAIGDALLRSILVRGHTANLDLAAFHCEELVLAIQETYQQWRDSVVWTEHTRILHIVQMLGYIPLAFRTQELRYRYVVLRHDHGTVLRDLDRLSIRRFGGDTHIHMNRRQQNRCRSCER